ncbi:MAG: hypothetical protein M1833_005486 [Piccolia ochrophora]|nr:MAG: hypothetical protein M1833_005486 [Piccolia ochrophora]
MSDRRKLVWAPSNRPPTPLPPHIHRSYITTPTGQLELLHAEPADTDAPRQPPIFFQHGGCECAAVWLPYMTYLSQQRNIPCYAISLRGHGASWALSYWRMFFTSKAALGDDILAGIRHVKYLEQKTHAFDSEVVLVAHSAGGGLSQYLLGRGALQVRALILVAAIPFSGSSGVYWNWFKMDPWFLLRSYWHLGHPISPLSSTTLVHRAFFSPECPRTVVRDFEPNICDYESMRWPIGLMHSFTNARDVLRNIRGRGLGPRLLILAGEVDRLMSVPIMARMRDGYQLAAKKMAQEVRADSEKEKEINVAIDQEQIWYAVVKGAHHLQNDVHWEDGAKEIAAFVEQQ